MAKRIHLFIESVVYGFLKYKLSKVIIINFIGQGRVRVNCTKWLGRWERENDIFLLAKSIK